MHLFYLLTGAMVLLLSCSPSRDGQVRFELVREWGGEEIFHDPFSVAAAGAKVYVSDSYKGEVFVFDREGGLQGSFGKGVLVTPAGISVSSAGHVFVADSNQDSVFEFSPQGELRGRWPAEDSQAEVLHGPVAVDLDPSGEKIYVLEFSGHRVTAFERKGPLAHSWGGLGDGDGKFYFPGDLRVSEDGEIYVSDTHNARIQVFSPEGAFLRSWGSGHDFHDPAGIDFDAQGRLFVADSGHYQVQIWTRTGKPLAVYSHPDWKPQQVSAAPSQGQVPPEGSQPAEGSHPHEGSHPDSSAGVASPLDLAFDDEGMLYVLHVAEQKIQKFRVGSK